MLNMQDKGDMSMVRQSFGIYKRDMKVIATNYAVLITVIALCILPSLYAWINIKASWDPYASSATSRIKVAVVNNDEGTVLNGKEISVGQEVVNGLNEKPLLGWQFLKEEEAMQQLRKGRIFAVIIIPKTFSQDLTSLVTSDIRTAKIKYIVNEKLNAIAPKITSKGASGIQTTVSEEVVQTVSGIVLEMAKELGIEVEDVVLPKLVEAATMLHSVENKFQAADELSMKTQEELENFSAFLLDLTDYMPRLEKILIGVQDLTGSVDEFLNTAKLGIDTFGPTIKKDIGLISEISGEAANYIESISEMIETGSDKVPEMINNLLKKADTANKLISSLLKVLRGIDKVSNSTALQGTISQLETAQGKTSTIKSQLETINKAVADGKVPDASSLNKVKILFLDVQQTMQYLYDNFDVQIMESINDIFDKAGTVVTGSSEIVADIKAALPDILDIIIKAQEITATGSTSLEKIQELLPEVEKRVMALTAKIDEVNENRQLRDIIALIKEDVEKRSDFLAESTAIEEETIFPMGNYGSQMTPFYSALAAWVGLTILVSMISVEAKGEYRSFEVYFGKLMTYLTITLIQGAVIGLGDLFLLQIYCLNPWLFFLGMLLVTVTFTVIVYSLVSVFGNVGKVVAIILMIIQVAGSGGTFPVQLTSSFFITINPYLPFTYAISLLREGIGGVESSVLTEDLIVLVIFIAGSMIISIVLKKYMNKLLAGFVHKVHEGGL